MHLLKQPVATVLTTATIVAMAGATLTSCSDEARRLNVDKNEEYTREFIKEFGIYDSNHDWNTATRYSATVNPTAAGQASTIILYTSQPGTPGCRIVAKYPATARTLSFDMSKMSEYVYAEFLDSSERVITSAYYPLKSSSITIGEAAGHRVPVMNARPPSATASDLAT